MSDPLAKWGFKEKVWIQRTDAGGYAITLAGVDVIGQSGLIYAKNLMLPESRVASENQSNK